MKYKVTNIIFLMVLFSGCDLINPKEKLPAYVQIDDFKVVGDEEDRINNIRDVWIGTKSSDLGIYQLPASIPVLEDGDVELTIYGGVYLNGIKSDRNKYFFYKPLDVTLKLIEGETIKYSPETAYTDETVFSVEGSERFEDGALNFKGASGTDFEVLKENDNRFGQVKSTSGSQIEMLSKKRFLIKNDKKNAPVYLEFDYKSNVNMQAGLYITFNDFTETVPFVTFNSSNGEWNHAVVELDNEVNLSGSETLYEIFFRGGEKSTLDDYIAIDNVKVVYEE